MTHTDLPSQSAFDDIIDTLPCSVSQTRFWFLEKMEPGNTALNVAVRWEIRGRFNAETIERAFRMVVDRHEVLRTRFVEQDGEPMQQIMAAAPFKLSIIDLTRLPDATRLEEARSISIREAQTPFDLTQAPLIRVTMLQLADDRAQLLITVHHIAFDGWSIRVIGREIGKIASALDAGREPDVPELQLQYADFSLWQRDFMQSESFAEDTAYWVEQLADAPYFELPTDRSRPQRQTFGGEIISTVVPGDVSDKLTALAKSEGVSLFSLGAATMTTALHRFTGKSDIVIGTQVANRDETDLEDLIGVFINNIVLRLDAQGNPSFNELLHRCSKAVNDGLVRTHVPFDDLVRKLRRAPDLSRTPLYSINFIFQGAFMENARYGEFDLTGLPSESPGALLDFNFLLVRRPDHWRASLEFNTDLFEKTTAQRLLDLWVASMKAAAETPVKRIAELNVTAHTETRRQAPLYPRDKAVAALFADIAAAQPTAIALKEGTRQLNYADLDKHANQMARMLQNLGARKGRRVALVAPRSIETIVTLLAIAKTGAAYAAVDADGAAEQIAYVLEDCAPAILVAHKDARGKLSGFKGPIVDLDVATTESAESDAPIISDVGANDTLYVAYAKDGAAKAKGVLASHRSIARTALADDKFRLAPQHVMLHASPLNSKAGAHEIWTALLAGARLAIVKANAPDPSDFVQAISADAVTTALLPATMFTLVAEHHAPALRGLQRVLVYGAPSASATRRAHDANPSLEIVRLEGSAEAGGFVLAHTIARNQSLNQDMPLGAPMRGVECYVIDRYGQTAPAGGLGELYVGGDGVALGYNNLPDLTAQKFVADQFSSDAGARLYRTGDLVRLRPDGLIERLGRINASADNAELKDIEAALIAHESVDSAVAITRDNAIFAYVTPAATRIEPLEALPATLRAYLAATHAQLTQPSAISVLRALPTAVRDLPTVAVQTQAPAAPAAAPAAHADSLTDTQMRVRRIWQELLKTEQIGLDDSFFDLGGHSLLAVRLLVRVQEEFNRKLEVLALFKQPTLRAFCTLLETPPAPIETPAVKVEDWQVFKLQPNGSKTPIIAIDNPILYYALSKKLGADQPFTAIQLFNPDRPQSLAPESFEQMASHYVSLLKTAHPTGPYILMGLCIAGSVAVEVARQLQAAGDEVEAVIAYDTWRPGYTRSLSLPQRAAIDLTDRMASHINRWKALCAGEMSLSEWATSFKFTHKLLSLAVKAGWLKAMPERPEEWSPPWYQAHQRRARGAYGIDTFNSDLLLFKSDQAMRGAFFDADFGWARINKGRTVLHDTPGQHLSMLAEPHVDSIAARIRAFLKSDGA